MLIRPPYGFGYWFLTTLIPLIELKPIPRLIIKFKIIFIGSYGVGKTSILHNYFNKEFNNTPGYTIGVNFYYKHVIIDENNLKLHFWDTAGQERFRSITRSYYRGAHGIIITYDITNKNSFDKVKEWISEIEKNIKY